MKKIFFLLHKHLSFVIMLSGAVGMYLLSLWLKFILNPFEYGQFSLILSFFTISMTFGPLGLDQVFMRITKISNEGLTLSKTMNHLIIFTITSISIAFTLFFHIYYAPKLNIFLLFSCSFGLSLGSYLFAIYRISNLFNEAQLLRNGWRFITLIILFGIVLFKIEIDINFVLIIFSFSILICLIKYSREGFKLLIINSADKRPDYSLWFGFGLSMFIMTFLNNSDRFIIDSFLEKKDVGDFFFLQNLFLFPLTQIQNYSGFKEISKFKLSFSNQSLNSSLLRNFIIAIIIIPLLVISYLVFERLFKINLIPSWTKNAGIIAILLCTGLIRILYSVLAAAMGAIGNVQMIKSVNLFTVFFISLALLFFSIFEGSVSILLITQIILCVWIARAFIFYTNLIRYNNAI